MFQRLSNEELEYARRTLREVMVLKARIRGSLDSLKGGIEGRVRRLGIADANTSAAITELAAKWRP